jgi:N-acetylglucosaminyldiphosphoundecaprenol N-acetyl-beta-D-mannosaminyltransferase
MSQRTHLFGIDFDPLTMPEVVTRVLTWAGMPEYRCHYVVTPNVDHVVKIQDDARLRTAYRDAALVVVDGKPVWLASRLVGKPLPAVVPGSDLCPALFDAANNGVGLRVFLLGAAEGVAERAARIIEARWPRITVCGYFSPPMGFSATSPANDTILELIDAAQPDVLLIGLGAPKQEIWVQAMRERLRVKVALCVGATIDFLAGEKARAPRWMRAAGLEWLHRALSEPKRLMGRYWHDAQVFPRLVLREFFAR